MHRPLVARLGGCGSSGTAAGRSPRCPCERLESSRLLPPTGRSSTPRRGTLPPRRLSSVLLLTSQSGVRVELEPVRLAPGLGDGFVRLRALVRLNLQDASRASRSGGAALALRVIRLERRDRAEEQRRVPSAAEQLDRRVQLGDVRTKPPGAKHEALEALPVRLSRLEVVDAHVDVGPMFGQVVRVGDPLEVPHVDGLIGRFNQLPRQMRLQGAWCLGGCAGSFVPANDIYRSRNRGLRTAAGRPTRVAVPARPPCCQLGDRAGKAMASSGLPASILKKCRRLARWSGTVVSSSTARV